MKATPALLAATAAMVASASLVAAAAWARAEVGDDTASLMDRADKWQELMRSQPAAVLAELRMLERAPGIRSRTLAQALLYEHAAHFGLDPKEIERIRGVLIAVGEDRHAPAYARDEACRVLLSSDWPGRFAWYDRLLADQTLRHLSDDVWSFDPLTHPLETDPDTWVPRLIPKLAKKGVVRSNVADALAELAGRARDAKKPPRRDVAIALLPWLADRGWAAADVDYSVSPRAEYITSLEGLDVPEAIPELIHVVETEQDSVGARAAGALEHFRDPRALPALRKALPAHLHADWEREAFLRAIAACGGRTPGDASAALEAYARAAADPERLERIRMSDLPGPMDEKLALGIHLAHERTVDEAIVGQVVTSVRRQRDPAVAYALEAPLFFWSSRTARLHIVSRLADRDLDDRLLRTALGARDVISAAVGPELRALLARGGTGAGRAAAMLDDRDAIMRVLRGRDIRAIFGLFHACAVSDQRGLDYSSDWRVSTWGGKGRESVRLPLAEVGPLLARAEPDVAAAAHAWLAHEGGPAAKAWLASRGRLTAAPAAETHAFSIAGVTPGMKRADVQRLAAKAVGVKYDEHGSAVVVSGNSLRDGAREIVSSATRAGDVRDLFGRPDREHSDHVFATMGGFFWQYERSGVVIVFSFTDDRFTLNEKAPLFQVKLLDPAAHRAMPKP